MSAQGTRATTLVLLAATLLAPWGLDASVRDAVRRLRSPGLDRSMQAITDAGKPQVVLGALLLVAVLDEAAGVLTARRALLALLPLNLVVEGVKRAVGRERPDGERKRSNASFPSSHAANAAALAVVLARRWRRLALAFAVIASAVCVARVLLERHWLSDVAAGAALGVVAATLACRWLGDRRGAPVAARPTREDARDAGRAGEAGEPIARR